MIYNQQPKTMAEYNFVAVDLGATSGRVILATFGALKSSTFFTTRTRR